MVKLYRKKEPCKHEEAIDDGNPDWPGLICKKCRKEVKADHYEEVKYIDHP